MGLFNLSKKSSVLKAIAEYERLGQDKFLSNYGFKKSRSYFLKYENKYYDSKAIVAVAHKYEFPQKGPLTSDEFSGGKHTVKKQLEKLGFHISILDSYQINLKKPSTSEVFAREEEAGNQEDFNPENLEDARTKVLRSIALRKGQPKFRKGLLKAYDEKCAMTGCDVLETLEVAHIIPYKGEHTNHVTNGILLRADIHILFDMGLIAIDSLTNQIILSDELNNTVYKRLKGKVINLPSQHSNQPNKNALDRHRDYSNL